MFGNPKVCDVDTVMQLQHFSREGRLQDLAPHCFYAYNMQASLTGGP